MSRNGITTIVITGGPCAGKSTVIDKIADLSLSAQLVPEIATLLISNGFPKPGEDLPYTPEWQYLFQQAASACQVSFEDINLLLAKQRGRDILIMDRGLIDGAAYMPGGLPEFLSMYDINLKQAFDRYDAVIHLESLAVAQPELYSAVSNNARYEDLAWAQSIEWKLRQVWSGHPNRTIIRNSGDEDELVLAALKCLQMNLDKLQSS